MAELEAAIEGIRAVRDCPAVRALCLDCWAYAQRNGEAAGLAWARMLLDGVTRYVEHEKRTRAPLYGA